MNRILAAIVALALPALLLAAWVASWRSAGPSRSALALERRLRANHPEVVILGSSVAFRDVDRERLARDLDLPVDRVLMASVPASTAAHWYAQLRWQVLDGPRPPKLIVVVDALASMLTPDVEGHEERLRLAEYVESPDRALGLKAFGDPDGVAAEHRRLAWRELRRAAVGGVPDALVGWWSGAHASDGRQLVLEATDRVFATDRKRLDRPTGLPEMFRPPEPERAWHIPERPDDSFLPELLDLCRERGARVLLARAPFPPSFPDVDRLPPPVERDAAAFIEAHGGAWLDLRSLGLDDAWFTDRDHASPAGAARITDRVAQEIAARGLLAGPPGPGGWVPPLGRATLDGATLDPLARAGGVDLPAGAELVIADTVAWPEGSRLTVRSTGPATLSAAWGDVALAAGVGGLTAPLPSGPGPLRLRSDAPTHLVSVSLGAPTRMAWWVGDDVDARPPTLRLAGGRTSDHHTVPTFAAPPPELPPAQARGARLLAPKLTALADAPSDPEALGRLEEGAQAGNDYLADACSPVRVLEDGAPLAWPDTFCAHVAQLGHGRTCHVGDAVQFSSSDGTDPQRNGRRYTLALDPSRACKLKVRRGETAIHDGWWLYPGDAASFLAPPERRALLAAPATQVAVRAIAVTGDDDLVIEAGGAVLTVPAADLRDDATVTLTLTGPVSADAPVVVRAPGHTYWLLTYLALSSS